MKKIVFKYFLYFDLFPDQWPSKHYRKSLSNNEYVQQRIVKIVMSNIWYIVTIMWHFCCHKIHLLQSAVLLQGRCKLWEQLSTTWSPVISPDRKSSVQLPPLYWGSRLLRSSDSARLTCENEVGGGTGPARWLISHIGLWCSDKYNKQH